MTNIYYTADPHFLHARIIELSGRPFGSPEEMSQTILDNINDTCTADDTLVMLGDVALGKLVDSLEYIRAINAHTILVPGNHDRLSRANHKEYSKPDKLQRWVETYGEVFDEVLVELPEGPSSWPAIGEFPGFSPLMSHYPYQGDSHDKDRVRELRPKDEGQPIIHGHVHEKWHTNGRQFNVGVDVNDFRPVHTDTINEWMGTL